MSQENVEVVAEYARSAARGVDAMAEFWDPDISHRAVEGAIDDAGELHGPEAVRRYAQDWFDMFDDLSVVAEELVDAGDDRVVAVLRMTGRAKVSGIETEIRFSVVYTLRNGKIVQGREYMEKEQAPRSRRAAGVGDRIAALAEVSAARLHGSPMRCARTRASVGGCALPCPTTRSAPPAASRLACTSRSGA